MAEIKIEKKKPIWPWILLALLIVGIVAYVIANKNDDDFGDDVDDHVNNSVEDSTKFKIDNNDGAVYNTNNDYKDHNNAMAELMIAMKDSTRFGMDSTYTNNALYNLAKVTLEKAKEHNVENSKSLTDLQQYVSSMDTASSMEKVDNNKQFKSVSDHIVAVIEIIQKKDMPTKQGEVAKLKQTTSNLNATADMSKQQSNIQLFFRQAHDLLHDMNS